MVESETFIMPNIMTPIGELDASEAFLFLQQHPQAVLLDVRTPYEWQMKGIPALSPLPNPVYFIPWREGNTMEINPCFVARVTELVSSEDTPLILLCKSGGRSYEAAKALAGAGYTTLYNLVGGFEGSESLRGWIESALPWEVTVNGSC